MQPNALRKYSHCYTKPWFCSLNDISVFFQDCCRDFFFLFFLHPHHSCRFDTYPASQQLHVTSTAVVVSLLLILSRQKEKPQHTSKPFLSIFLSLPHHVLYHELWGHTCGELRARRPPAWSKGVRGEGLLGGFGVLRCKKAVKWKEKQGQEASAAPAGARNPSLITGRPLSHPRDPGVGG